MAIETQTLKNVKLGEVAEVAGVSVSTVSRAFNNHSCVNVRTRRRVIAVAQSLQLQRKTHGLPLKSCATKSIILVQPLLDREIGNPEVSMFVLENIQEIAEQNGCSVMTSQFRSHNSKELPLWLSHSSDSIGIIGLGLRDGDAAEFIAHAHRANIPFILLNSTSEVPTVPTCSTDHVRSGQIAIEYLLELGHRRIGLLFSSLRAQSCCKRLQGISEVFSQRHIEHPETLLKTGLEKTEVCLQEARRMVEQEGATALIAPHDRLARVIMSDALSRGIKIPDDLSVISFDGSLFGEQTHPTLTSVYVPWAEMSRAASQMLILLKNDSLLKQIKLVWTPQLIKCGSCGPPKKK